MESPLLLISSSLTLMTGWQNTLLARRDFSWSVKQKVLFQLPLNKTFYLTPITLTHKQGKQPHEKINKIILSTSTWLVFHKNLQYLNWKANKRSTLPMMELRPPVSESPTKIPKLYAPADSEHRFHKVRIRNLYSNWAPPWLE